MITKVKTEILDPDTFDEIGEFDMPVEKDSILNTNIDRETDILNEYAEKHGFKKLDW